MASDPPHAGILDLPEALLIDNLSPYLSASDLANLRQASRRSRDVFDDEVLWKRKTVNDFNFPPHASARVGGWRRLYRGLAHPQVWVWGQTSNARLGLAHPGAPADKDTIHRISRQFNEGIPFPVKNDVLAAASATKPASSSEQSNGGSQSQPQGQPAQALDRSALGSVVELVAGGWSFHARTSTGKVIYWGSLNGEGFAGPHASDRDPFKEIDSPTLLQLPDDIVVRQLSCGRSHAVALTDAGDVLEWRAWGTVWKHDGLLPAPSTHCEVEQLEAGWDFSALLVSTPTEILQHIADGETKRSKQTDIFLWYPDFTEDRYRQAYFSDEAESSFQRAWPRPLGEDRLARVDSPSVKLPALPEREGSAGTGQHIIRIAAGENFILALTASGLVYKLDLPHRSTDPGDRQLPDGSERSLADRQRLALARQCEQNGVRWKLLAHFCQPDRIRALETLSGAVDGKSDEQLRISHISAHFRTFVVYSTSTASAQHTAATSATRPGGGLILLGANEAGEDTEPTVVPQLQNAAVIKVVLGDYHFGALTESGEVMTWGSWSKGALGQWHDLPRAAQPSESPTPTQTEDEGYDDTVNLVPLPRVMPHFRVGWPGRIVPRAGSRAALRARAGFGRPEAGGSSSDPLEIREIPERVEEPRAVQFRPLPSIGGGRTLGEAGQVEGKTALKSFAFDVAFAGWHSSALVMEASEGGDDAVVG